MFLWVQRRTQRDYWGYRRAKLGGQEQDRVLCGGILDIHFGAQNRKAQIFFLMF